MNNYTTLTRYKAATPRSARRQKGYTVPTISLPSGNSVSLGGVVMLSGEQTISSIKDFLAGIKIGGLLVYSSKPDTIFVDGNLVVRGAVTMYGDNGTTAPSIFEALPIDNETIKRNSNGELYAVGRGGSGTGGGISIADVEYYLTTNGYATQSWVTGKGYITGITSSMVTKALGYTPFSNAGGTVNGAVTINHSGNTPLVINQNYGTVSNPRGVVVMNSTLSNGNLYISHLFGKGGSMRNSAWVGFYLDSAGSNNNRLSMGLYGVDNVLNILGSGSVVVGGTTASEKLEVHGNIKASGVLKLPAVDSGFTNPRIVFGDSIIRIGATTTGLLGIYASGDIRLNPNSASSANNTVGLFLKTTGLNGINNNAPTEALDVAGNILASGTMRLSTLASNAFTGAQLLWGNGEARIGVNASSKRMTMYAESFRFRTAASVASSSVGVDIDVSGNLLLSGVLTLNYSSDKRLKKNIRKVNASEVLMSLGGVWQYEYTDSEVQKNSTYGGSHYGLIYQNVKGTALTSMCFEREDGFGTLNYLDTNFISLIAGATMECCTEIEKLKKENKALRKEVELLKQRVA